MNHTIERRKVAYTYLKRIGAPKPTGMVVHRDDEYTVTFTNHDTMLAALFELNVANVRVIRFTNELNSVHWIRFVLPQERQEVSK